MSAPDLWFVDCRPCLTRSGVEFIVRDADWLEVANCGSREKDAVQVAIGQNALLKIHGLMDGQQWGPDTCQDIALILEAAGWPCHEITEGESVDG